MKNSPNNGTLEEDSMLTRGYINYIWRTEWIWYRRWDTPQSRFMHVQTKCQALFWQDDLVSKQLWKLSIQVTMYK